ncbi:hypothetical protein NVP1102O_19 [Vibrio phage 1.102.O._10N.261.45.E3]|uniref:Uncharacterized protein n=8 Tax=Autolykiviridae TaxID=2184034 RepID=A0A2I7R1X9_9VIRU|nr:hypothetical protein KMD64_gp18 [Vibrio phage 1.044.O._10N.261.51.B8]AUR83901.1 hypothetical protein NVP1043O_18 [Vibrio phage 1.043.O._10N.261.52.C7]AUR84106.1 hypothetical protein NVP1048O_19 [Vibrio phage 1.048.O._10N.286.46.A10]AUR87143.1 hypothetical protein NVP1095O_19 [Vibrio phage 1.095.O._10N.286.46.E10]AUR87654.1 hypothetical protein NVP1102O_19 [Vibrio phage 1.102.O._10N.261.45.E3]AUR88019.1 hypothetical protein NVP1107A_19 [Vibrio phage 1.107.A._10N.286.52.E10]AUR88041.1 hypoth
MPIIREYVLNDLLPNQGNSKVINVTGRTIVIRRATNAGRVRVKAYTKEGGSLIADNIMDAGEKITTATEFTRLEVFNFEVDIRNVAITAGDGDFQSDVVEGEVTVKTDSSNPLVIASPKYVTSSSFIQHVSGTNSPLIPPAGTVEFGVQLQGADGAVVIEGGAIFLTKNQLYSSKFGDSSTAFIPDWAVSATYVVQWVAQD